MFTSVLTSIIRHVYLIRWSLSCWHGVKHKYILTSWIVYLRWQVSRWRFVNHYSHERERPRDCTSRAALPEYHALTTISGWQRLCDLFRGTGTTSSCVRVAAAPGAAFFTVPPEDFAHVRHNPPQLILLQAGRTRWTTRSGHSSAAGFEHTRSSHWKWEREMEMWERVT